MKTLEYAALSSLTIVVIRMIGVDIVGLDLVVISRRDHGLQGHCALFTT